MRSFAKVAGRFASLYLVSCLFLILGVLMDSLIPRMIQLIIDNVIIAQQLQLAVRLLILLFSCFLMRGIFKYLEEFTSDCISKRVTRDVRSELFSHITRQGASFFRSNEPSELMSRVRHDSDNLGFAFGFQIIFSIEIIFHIIVMFFCIVRISPVLSIPALIFMPLIAVMTIREETQGDHISEEISEETAAMNRTAGEALSGIRTVKAFSAEEKEKKRFSGRNRHFYSLSVSLSDLYAKYDSATASLSRIMQAFAILFAGILVMHERLTLGELASYVEYINSLVWPMLEIGWLTAAFASANASGRKIRRLLDEHDEIHVMPPQESLDDGPLSVRFEAVSFSPDGTSVLKDISFEVKPGQSLGIMGETGSGKSTIGNLLTRSVEPTSGRILLQNKDITHIAPEEVRRKISVVSQDSFLFSESIRSNIKKGGLDAYSDEEMERAAALSSAHSFISRLEEGYDTVIGERGVGLSGGQKQRLCISRALIKKAPVLLLDDSTSALDMETEKEIQSALESTGEEGVKLIIAHRISAVRHADEIIYLSGGQIAERGTHSELMAMKGLYYETFIAQYSKEEADVCTQ